MIGKSGTPISRISQAHADRVEVRGRDLTGDVMGRLSFTEYFHLLLTGEEPTRGAAVLPRPAAGGDRRARDDAHQRGGADDALGRPGVAAGGRRGGDPRLRAGDPRHRRGVRAAARAGARARPGRARARDPRGGGEAAGLRPPGPQAAGPPRGADPRAGRRARRLRRARRARARVPGGRRRGVGPAADDERLDADRRRDARPRLPGRDGQGRPDPRAHGRPARPPRRGARAAARVPDGRRGGGGRHATRRHDRRRRPTRRSSPTCWSARPSTGRSSPATTRAAGWRRSRRCR